MSEITSFSQIVDARKENPLRVDSVEVDGLGTVFLREMDADAMAQFLTVDSDTKEDEYSALKSARVIVLHLCDKDGALLVKPKDREKSAKELAQHRFKTVTGLYMDCLRVSGLATEEITEQAGN